MVIQDCREIIETHINTGMVIMDWLEIVPSLLFYLVEITL